MFKLKQSDSYAWPVEVSFPVSGGRYEKQTFDVEFKRLPQKRINDLVKGIETTNDGDLCREVVLGWKGVTDESGELPFSAEALEKLLDVQLVSAAIVVAFVASLRGAPAKN